MSKDKTIIPASVVEQLGYSMSDIDTAIGVGDEQIDKRATEHIAPENLAFASRLYRNPYAQQRIGKVRVALAAGAKAPPLVTPADVLGNVCLQAMEVASRKEDTQQIQLSRAKALMQAMPFLWTEDIVHTVRSMPPLHRHVVDPGILPFREMLWVLQVPLYRRHRGKICITEFVYIDGGTRGFQVVEDVVIADEDDGIDRLAWAQSVQYGQMFEPLHSDGKLFETAPASSALMMLAFLNSPYVRAQIERPNRAERRREKKTEGTESTVTVVKWRQEKKTKSDSEEGEPQHRDYRWWVRGHIRYQWYPSTKSHRPIYIAPYLKGPEAQPIKPRVDLVVR